MAMESVMAVVPYLTPAIENLKSLLQNGVALLWGVESDMKKLSSTLSTIHAVLEDAEQKQLKDKAMQNWLKELNDAAYEADDILDEYAFEALRCESKGQGSFASLKRKVLSYLPITYASPNILFRHNIGNRIKEITDKFDAIAANRSKFHLNERVVVEKQVEYDVSRETSSVIAQPQLYGRDEDRDKIVKFLVEDVCDSEHVSVFPILGIGGLGKTTLAQMAFNDERVEHHFDLKIWVYVSQDFDVKRVIKATIESANGYASEAVDLDSLQRKLRNMLNGKRYLIVLDDVWDEDPEKWDALKYSLACGSKGASVIVTTRIEKVASIMGTISPHRLSILSEKDCWLLFRQRAFGRGNEEHPNLVAIGKEIVKKCGGVPLAAKALGGLMRFKSMNGNGAGRGRGSPSPSPIPDGQNFPVPGPDPRRVIYHSPHPPSPTGIGFPRPRNSPILINRSKNNRLTDQKTTDRDRGLIFKYRLLPVGGIFRGKTAKIGIGVGDPRRVGFKLPSLFKSQEKEWLHVKESEIWNLPQHKNSILPALRLRWEPEDIGDQIWNELCLICFFQEVKNYDSNIRFKMHDLVHDLAQSIMKDECQMIELNSSSNISNEKVRHVTLVVRHRDNFKNTFHKSLRTLRLHSTISFEDDELLCDFRKFGSLRAFDAGAREMKELPSSIGHLKHLRLPQNMMHLRSLRHLYLFGCQLIEMPPKIGQLTNLKTLNTFVLGKSTDCSLLAELKCLNLGGELCIKHLERVSNPMDAKEANLVGKQNLSQLQLNWEYGLAECESQGNIESEAQENVKSELVLEALQPHPNLKELVVSGYKGTHFPPWMRGSDLRNVVNIELYWCKNCLKLPPLGQLPLLRSLQVVRMEEVVEYIENEYPGGGGFPSLEELRVYNCPKLEGLSRKEGRELFPRLREIRITDCPKLSFPHLSSPKELWLQDKCTMVLNSISNLSSLTSLTICQDEETVCFPKEFLRNLTLLESLSILDWRELKVLPEDLASLVSLKSLKIQECRKLESLPKEGLRGLESLQSLRICRCPKIASLPASIQSLTKLQRIEIKFCGRELGRQCERGKGDDWYKIAHIPEVSIIEVFEHQPRRRSGSVIEYGKKSNVLGYVAHEAFMLGTTKAKHDKEGFELFITTAPIPDLNEKLIVFGRVIKGEDVVQEIEEVDTDEHYRPKSPIGIINVTLKEKCACDWDDRGKMFIEVEGILRRQIKMSVIPSVQPFHAIAYPLDPMLALEISRKYAAHCSVTAARLVVSSCAIYCPLLCRHARYVSSDFGNHQLSHLMGSVFGMHNRENVEVFCYALSPNDGTEWRLRIQTKAGHFLDVSSVSSDIIARMINDDQIQILVNLNGYTKGARNEIFAMQPAPIQVSYMGFPGTTGASYIPYLVIDKRHYAMPIQRAQMCCGLVCEW
ncbi:unnamed protein product [Camellia sinensis]